MKTKKGSAFGVLSRVPVGNSSLYPWWGFDPKRGFTHSQLGSLVMEGEQSGYGHWYYCERVLDNVCEKIARLDRVERNTLEENTGLGCRTMTDYLLSLKDAVTYVKDHLRIDDSQLTTIIKLYKSGVFSALDATLGSNVSGIILTLYKEQVNML